MKTCNAKLKKQPQKCQKLASKPPCYKISIIYASDHGIYTDIAKGVTRCNRQILTHNLPSSLLKFSSKFRYNNNVTKLLISAGICHVFMSQCAVAMMASAGAVPEQGAKASNSSEKDELGRDIAKVGMTAGLETIILGKHFFEYIREKINCAFFNLGDTNCTQLRFFIGIGIIFFVLLTGFLLFVSFVCTPASKIPFYRKRKAKHIEYYEGLAQEEEEMDEEEINGGQLIGPMLPGQIMPGPMMPGPMLPGQMMPGPMMPGPMMPGLMMPGQMMPGQMMSGSMMPGLMMPGQMALGQMGPGPMMPGQMALGQLSPGQMSPGQIAYGTMSGYTYQQKVNDDGDRACTPNAHANHSEQNERPQNYEERVQQKQVQILYVNGKKCQNGKSDKSDKHERHKTEPSILTPTDAHERVQKDEFAITYQPM
ncbi:hypothetical protein, conserved [Plasmodium vivax]|uniref:Uncharacterized protein n=1 Tax=Plasmodium vivax TaxID=5855 RepID=A0A1G4HC77_PLAVI|nr:hypothetical protein, conserved [Plasmodium vivax]